MVFFPTTICFGGFFWIFPLQKGCLKYIKLVLRNAALYWPLLFIIDLFQFLPGYFIDIQCVFKRNFAEILPRLLNITLMLINTNLTLVFLKDYITLARSSLLQAFCTFAPS